MDKEHDYVWIINIVVYCLVKKRQGGWLLRNMNKEHDRDRLLKKEYYEWFFVSMKHDKGCLLNKGTSWELSA